jgi:hypothetical protein
MPVDTFERYLKELRDKYPPGTKIRSNKYPKIDGQHLQGKQILEIPASNKNFEGIKNTRLWQEINMVLNLGTERNKRWINRWCKY